MVFQAKTHDKNFLLNWAPGLAVAIAGLVVVAVAGLAVAISRLVVAVAGVQVALKVVVLQLGVGHGCGGQDCCN